MRIREIRKSKKMSGTKIADYLGITPQYYYSLERGERNLSADIALKLAFFLKTTTDYLLGKPDNNDELTLSDPEDPKIDHEAILELSDKKLFERFTLMLDGEKISNVELKGIIAYLRAYRTLLSADPFVTHHENHKMGT